MANRVIGKIAMTPKGDWNSLIPYEILDVVTNNNVMYVALKDVPAGTPTTDLTYWLRLIAGSGGIAPDTQMSDSSANPVENRVIKSYVDTEIQSIKNLVDNKVDKETGKGLSSNDYTNTDKGKVDLVGSGTLTTTAQTLIGAINEHETNIQTLDSSVGSLRDDVDGLQTEVGLINGAIDFDLTSDRVAVPLTNGQTTAVYTLPYDAYIQIGSRNNLALILNLKFNGTLRSVITAYSTHSGIADTKGICLKKGTEITISSNAAFNTAHQSVWLFKLK